MVVVVVAVVVDVVFAATVRVGVGRSSGIKASTLLPLLLLWRVNIHQHTCDLQLPPSVLKKTISHSQISAFLSGNEVFHASRRGFCKKDGA